MSEALNNEIKEYFEDIHRYISANDHTLDENVIQNSQLSRQFEKQHIDEAQRRIPSFSAMIGKFLNLQTNDDFVKWYQVIHWRTSFEFS